MDLQAKAAALMSPHDCLMTAEQLRVIFTLSAFTCTRPELAVFALDDPSLLASNVPAEPVAAPSPGSPTKQGADSKTQPLEDDLELARKSEAVNRGLTFDQANCALAPRAPRTTSARSLPRASNARRSSSIASVGARSSRSRRVTFTPTTAERALWCVCFFQLLRPRVISRDRCAGGALARSHAAGRRRYVEASLLFARAARGVRGICAEKGAGKGDQTGPRRSSGRRQDNRVAVRHARVACPPRLSYSGVDGAGTSRRCVY